MKHFAHSRLTIKASSADGAKLRTFSGVATTPTADRGGDIVEPMGAEFQLPIPLLWQHNASQPIGWVRSARVSKDGIDIDGEIASIDEPGKLKDRLDEAWQSIKLGLVPGLSIGFKPKESARIGDSYAYRYLKWLWLELSAVTIPMNGEASIEAIKAADAPFIRAASGAGRIVRLDPVDYKSADPSQPGDTGSASRRKGVVYLNP
jgi:uncharacterized protein